MRIVSEILLAVLNSLWQAAVVAAVVWLALRLLRGGFGTFGTLIKPINAATRYAIWWAVLAVTLALPAAPAAVAWWHARARPTLEAVPRVATPRPAPAPVIDESPAIVTLQEQRASRWPAWVLAAWAALCLYRLLQIGRSYIYLRGVKRRAILSQAALPPIVRPARLLLSEEISSPMAVGFLHPAVILPESLPGELAQPEMEHVLLHEAAHLARKDDWTNLLARLLGAALALHPVAWWILRQIEREREIACDDWVVARTGSARPYALSLARMSELRWSKRGTAHESNQGEALASGIFGGGSRLGERIERLLERGRDFSPRASKVRVAASVAALLACVTAGSVAPRLIAFAQQPVFEVASVRPSKTGSPMFGVGVGRSSSQSVTLRMLMTVAYRVQDFQISGGPAWVGSARFDVEARAENPNADPDQVRLMLQSLLKDRFKLKLRRETKESPIYALVAAKEGPDMKLSADQTSPSVNGPSPQGTLNRGNIRIGAGSLVGNAVTMALFTKMLSQRLDHTIIDRTNLTGRFDLRLQWTPGVGETPFDPGGNPLSPAADTSGPSIFAALQEQLGLELKSTKGPVEVLVIDHAEKPDAN
jgi:uncharacterized protein (TIGR03435 family)